MLRTILILAAASLLCSVAYAQTKIGDNVLDIDSASILELESSSRGFLPSRMTSAQRDAQTQWDQAHIIYNTTENCLQIYTGSLWLCLQQGTPIDSSIYKQNGTLRSDRTVTMNGSDLTFDGSRDIIITDDGRLGIGDLSPDALLDVEGGTVRLSDYGSGVNSGQRTFLLGVDGDGDVITVDTSSVGTDDQTIDALFIQNDTLFISLEDDGVSDLFVNLAPYLDDINIYEADDTLTSNRSVLMDGKYIQFSNSDGRTRTRIDNDGDISQIGRNITHTLTDTSQDVQLELSAQGAFSTIGNTSDHPLNIMQNNTTAISVKADDYVRLNNYGDGNRTGTPSYIIGVDTDGDLLDVDLSTIGSDDQMIDTFSINGSDILLLSLENDGEAAKTVDLSPYLDDQTVSITGAGIATVAGTYPNFTITATEVDGSINNEAISNFTYTASSGRLRITESGPNFDATVSVMSGASSGSAGIRGLVPDALAGEQTYLLTAAGTWVDPSTLSGINIYTDNGTLDATRTVGLSTFDLIFDGTTDVIIESDGDVGIGTTSPSAKLHVAGNLRLDEEFEDKDGDAGSSGDVLTSTVTGTDWVAASTIGTDNQMIDTFSINGSNILQLSLEDDGEAAQTVDLSTYLDDQTVAITGAGINSVTGTYPNFTITGTEVDGSITNETITNFTYTASSGQLRITENAINFDATVAVMSGASGGSAGVRGLVPDALAGEQTYLLTAAGTWLNPSAITGVNIYTDDGTLDSDRTVGLSTFDLIFDGTSDVVIESDGDVGIGTTTPGARLEVAGGSVIFDEYGVGTHADTSADYILATNTDGDVVELNTAKNSRWFYAPAVTIDASDTITNTTLDLYQEYEDQFSSPDIRSTGAPTSLPLYSASDLWYYVSYHDDTVIDNISIDASGVMTYDIIDVPFDNYTIVNVIFLIK